MTNKQILEKAISKAVEGGWEGLLGEITAVLDVTSGSIERNCTLEFKGLHMLYNVEAIIFSHDFAKAFWGEGKEEISSYTEDGQVIISIQDWQSHLQQMVLERNPLKYLEQYID